MNGIKTILKKNQFLFNVFSETMRIERRRKKALKKEGLALIKKLEEALCDSGYLYFATCGTLLGIVRDNEFINGDNDVDYSIYTPDDFDWTTFEKKLNKFGFLKIRQFKVKGVIREQTYMRGKLTVDFFTIFERDGEFYSNGFFKMNDFIYSSPDEYSIREVRFIPVFHTQKVTFKGIQVTIPESIEEVLVCCYGDSWRIPDPDWDDNSEIRKNIKILNEFGYAQFFE